MEASGCSSYVNNGDGTCAVGVSCQGHLCRDRGKGKDNQTVN